jgi:hypothetical protein
MLIKLKIGTRVDFYTINAFQTVQIIPYIILILLFDNMLLLI